MTDSITLTHDASVEAFDSASGVVSADDDGVSFSWDEEHIVRVDAPADLEGAFDTDRFYKVEDATVARPIKQPYMVGDELKWYKKPAEELRKAAWSFDNAPYPIPHPDTGMVKDVNDIHGFWRNTRYDDEEDRMMADLYVPVNDDYALDFIEENQDVSAGFYNRVVTDYDGDTGDLTDDEGLDGFQVDMYGDHIAGVEHGRCSGEDGCGLDDRPHGTVIDIDTDTMQEHYDAPSGIYTADGKWFAVGPDEHTKDSTEYANDAMFPVDSCSDVEDAWNLRGHTDNLTIEKSTLESRIKRVDEAKDCGVVSDESQDDAPEVEDSDQTTEDCGCPNSTSTTMSDSDPNDGGFDIPDLSIDALVEKNDAVQDLKEERDSLREDLDEMDETVREAFDSAEHFSVELEEDECPCEAVEDLVADLDAKAEEVERLSDELQEYRAEEIEDRLDTLDDLGADRDEWEETADEADDPLDVLDEEIERREEVLDAVDAETSVKQVEDSGGTEESTDSDEGASTLHGGRSFGRGYGA